MKPMRRCLCLAISAALLATAAAVLPPSCGAETLTLKNGMRVILTSDSLASATDVALWLPAGARSEREGQSGLAHVAERVVARLGVQAGGGRWMKRLADAGGTPGSSSTHDYTEFFETLPAERLADALRLEAARLAPGATDPASFESERKRAREDLVRAQRTPVARGLQRISAALYAGDPYAHALLGTERDLAALTVRDVDAWRREHYAAGAATLTITGRFEPQGTLALVRALFEALPRGAASAAVPALKPAAPASDAVERSDAPASVLFAGWRVPGAADADAPAVALIAQVLAAPGSPLEKSLIDDWKSAALVQAGLDERRQASTLWGLAVLRADGDTSTARRALIDAVKSLAREGLAGGAFDRALRQLETNEALRLQGVRARAQAVGQAAVMGGGGDEQSRLRALHALTPADVQRVAARVFADAVPVTFWLLPANSEGGR